MVTDATELTRFFAKARGCPNERCAATKDPAALPYPFFRRNATRELRIYRADGEGVHAYVNQKTNRIAMETNQQYSQQDQYREPTGQSGAAAGHADKGDDEMADKIAANPRAAHLEGADENAGAPSPDPHGKLALNPDITHDEIVPPDALPSEKKVTSDIVGAEEENEIGTAAAGAGFAGGTGGGSNASEGRVGNPDNYGANQFGPGLATGPMSNDLSNGDAAR